MEKLADYEDAYNSLVELIKVSEHELLNEAVEDMDKILKANKEQEEAKPKLSQEEFNNMGYKEKVKFRKEHPKDYELLAGGR